MCAAVLCLETYQHTPVSWILSKGIHLSLCNWSLLYYNMLWDEYRCCHVRMHCCVFSG